MIILYGLFSLSHQHIWLQDVYFFCRCWPLLFIIGYVVDAYGISSLLSDGLFLTPSLDLLLALLTFILLQSFHSFESVLLLMLAYVGQLFMLHSCDLVSFYICLEAQNFCFLVLCGLQPNPNPSHPSKQAKVDTYRGPGYRYDLTAGSSLFAVEASLKYLIFSAFSSSIILFWFSAIYLRTGMSSLFFKSVSTEFCSQLESFQILLAMMFKLGAAPLHLWVVDIYGSVKKQLIMYISTAPKLSLFGFWVSSWHQVWTDFSIILFVIFTLVLGSFSAYGQPALRTLIAYSTVSEIGILLMAIETAGFHSLFQHLVIYIITQLILWNLSDKRLITGIAVSLAGLPPLSGFFTKAFIFWHVANQQQILLLVVALFTTAVALVYYIRMIRLFWTYPTNQSTRQINTRRNLSLSLNTTLANPFENPLTSREGLTSAGIVILLVAPLFILKPFVL